MRKFLVVGSLLFCLAVLFSCSGRDYGYAETRFPAVLSDEKARDFGGGRVNIFSPSSAFAQTEISPDETLSEEVSDAILCRNRDTELELNCRIVAESAPSVFEAVRADAESGSGRYGIVMADLSSDMALLYGGYLAELGKIASVDLSESFWNAEFLAATEAFGKNYLAVGDLDLSLYRSAYVTFADSSVLGGKLYDRLRELVSAGTFTVDKQTEIVSAVYTDVNGNSVRDGEDIFGYGTNRTGCADALLGAFGLELVSGGCGEGLSLAADAGTLSSAYRLIYELCASQQTFSADGNEGLYELSDMLFNGQLGMVSLPLCRAEGRKLTDEISVFPLPKFDEGQSDYLAFPSGGVSAAAIPANAPDREMSGAVLSVLCSRSRRDVLPVYFDSVTSGRYSGDESFRGFFSLSVDRFCFDGAFVFSDYLGSSASALISNRLLSGDVDNSAACSACIKSLARRLPELNLLISSLE